jgi:hypothetical protein
MYTRSVNDRRLHRDPTSTIRFSKGEQPDAVRRCEEVLGEVLAALKT